MLGNGSRALPQWIHTDEHQPFLYLSDNKSNEILKRTLLLASMFALCCVLLLGSSGHRRIFTSKAGSELTHRIHVFLFQMGVPLSILAVILFAFYFADARYYACSSGFSSSTLSNFSIPHHGYVCIGGMVCGNAMDLLGCSWRVLFATCSHSQCVRGRRDSNILLGFRSENDLQLLLVVHCGPIIFPLRGICSGERHPFQQ